MTHERGRMRALLHPITAPVIAGMRRPAQSDEAALAALMMRAYVGTIDYDGEDEADALVEVRHTLSGGKGPFLWTASHVIEREGVLAHHASVVFDVEPSVLADVAEVRGDGRHASAATRDLDHHLGRTPHDRGLDAPSDHRGLAPGHRV